MLIHPWDSPQSSSEWRAFVRAQGFGQIVAAGRDRDVPVIVPTQYVLEEAGGEDGIGDRVWLHLARPNPIWTPISENPRVVLAVTGDWAYIPSAWKAIGAEDPALGIPTTYYAAVQLIADAHVLDEPAEKLDAIRRLLDALQPDGGHADPAVHANRLAGIRGLRLDVTEVRGKFKYGGNVDDAHRRAVAERLAARGGPGDAAARSHLLRRI
jgi:transcriptional regulator